MDVFSFLLVKTPKKWLHLANASLPLLLSDHAACEYKAAQMALQLMKQYALELDSIKLSNLAREELLHYEKVNQISLSLGIKLKNFQPQDMQKFYFQKLPQKNHFA